MLAARSIPSSPCGPPSRPTAISRGPTPAPRTRSLTSAEPSKVKSSRAKSKTPAFPPGSSPFPSQPKRRRASTLVSMSISNWASPSRENPMFSAPAPRSRPIWRWRLRSPEKVISIRSASGKASASSPSMNSQLRPPPSPPRVSCQFSLRYFIKPLMVGRLVPSETSNL